MSPEPSAEILVLCVDDNADVAATLEALIATAEGLSCAGCITDAESVLSEVQARKPDVLLLDLTLPGFDTTKLIESIVCECPATRVLVYSGYDDQETAKKVIALGASGLISKHGDFDHLFDAIRRAARGETIATAR